jgi:hypothetical protein
MEVASARPGDLDLLMEFASIRFRSLLKAATKVENLPYTILGALALISLVARLILIF